MTEHIQPERVGQEGVKRTENNDPLLVLDPVCGDQEVKFLMENNILQALIEGRERFLRESKQKTSRIDNVHVGLLQQAAAGTLTYQTDDTLKAKSPLQLIPLNFKAARSTPRATTQDIDEGLANQPRVSRDCHLSKK